MLVNCIIGFYISTCTLVGDRYAMHRTYICIITSDHTQTVEVYTSGSEVNYKYVNQSLILSVWELKSVRLYTSQSANQFCSLLLAESEMSTYICTLHQQAT